MTGSEILALNLEEVRRRSVMIWHAVPGERAGWRPDAEAMSCIEMVRHVLEGEYLYTEMLKRGGSLPSDDSPFAGRPYTDVRSEMDFASPYRAELMKVVRSLTSQDLTTRAVDRSDKGYVRSAGDFILRMAYHESVHGGQLLGYLRAMNVPRPNIWD